MRKEGEGREVTGAFPVVSLPYLFIASSLWEKPCFVLKNSCKGRHEFQESLSCAKRTIKSILYTLNYGKKYSGYLFLI